MPIDLTEFERGLPFAGDYDAALAAAQDRLGLLQLSQVVHKRRAIVLVEGWEGAGKRAALKRLVAAWDPCQLATYCLGNEGDDERHWLARFWGRLPGAGHTSVFYRSWYSEAVAARLSGAIDDKAWSRATDEINEFESQQRDHGTLLIKLFFHLTAEEQAKRLGERRDDPWRRWLGAGDDSDALAHRERHESIWRDAIAHTNTRWAPWRIIDAGDRKAGQIAALTAIADAFAKAMPAEPPVEGDKVVFLNRSTNGRR